MENDQTTPESDVRATAWVHIQAGDALLAEGEEGAAEGEYRLALEFEPDLAEGHHHLAVALYKRGEFDEAAVAARHAAELSPTRVDAWFTLGLILWDARASEAAVDAFDRVIEIEPDRVEAHHYRGRVLYESGRPEAAVPSFARAAELLPESADIAHDIAIAHVACEAWPQAEEWFARCIELEPDNAETYYELGQAHEQDAATPDDRAEEPYVRAIALNPEHLPARFRLAVLWAKRRRVDAEARQAAIESLRQISEREDLVALFPDAHLVHYLLGAILDDMPGRHDDAVDAYAECLRLHPAFAPAHNNLGVLARTRRELDSAAEHFKLAIISDPTYDSALHNLCRVWYDQPNEVAIRQIRDLMDIIPDDAPDVIGRIMGHLVDVAKADAYASTYDKAHEIKNLIAILGARMRKSLSADACSEATDLPELMELHGRAFEAIRGYLSAIQVAPGEKELVDCAEMLRRCLRRLVVTKPAGVAVEHGIDANLPPLTADPKRLVQLFRNLVVNAFEAMPDGGMLRVRAEAFGAGSSRPGETVQRGVRICFEDSGAGMSDEEARRAFDPGYTTKERGSGYGLAVVSQIIREHGGTISLSTGEAGGLCVTVELPERVQPEAASERLRLRPVIYEDWRRLVQAELDAIGPSDGSSVRRSTEDGRTASGEDA